MKTIEEQAHASSSKRTELMTVFLSSGKDINIVLLPARDHWTSEVFIQAPGGQSLRVGLVRTTSDAHGQLFIDDLVVFTPYRNLGLGAATLKAIQREAWFAGLNTLVWLFGVEDEPLRAAQTALLARAGFAVVGDRATLALA
ncbi:MAG: GNAT family N-acetyltransferase [Myxococcales bacterium]|nr:GNAT family N-acetyltransferase [Myxococcales bacterium]